MAQGAPTIHNTNDQPYFYPRLIEPPVVENYTDQTLYRRDYDMWARTGGYDSYIPDLIGLKASVDELNTLVGVNTSTTVQAQLNLKENKSDLGSMAYQNANNVAITGGAISGASMSGNSFSGGSVSATTINNNINIPIGSSNIFGRGGAAIYDNSTLIYNSTTSFSDLMSYTLAANSFQNNNDKIEIEAAGSFSTGGGTRRMDLYLGSEVIYSTTSVSPNAATWTLKGVICRVGLNKQKTHILMVCSNTASIPLATIITSTSQIETGSILIKFVAEASDGAQKVLQDFLSLKWYRGA